MLFLALVSLPSTSALAAWSQKPTWSTREDAPSRKPARDMDHYQAAQPFSPGSNNIAVEVGQVFLMGDLGNSFNDNIGFQGHYTYGVSELFGFDSSFGYSSHSDGKFSMTSLLTGLRVNLSWYDRVVPHFVFGMGFYRPSYTFAGATPNSSSTLAPVLFGLHMGPGVDLQLSQIMFFGASVSFHNVFGTTKILADGTPFDVNGTFTSFLLKLGMSI